MKIKKNIYNFSYTITSNLVAFIVSTLVVLIVPKYIGVEEYGYMQVFVLYTSYAGFFYFGWPEGVLLRYGGKSYKELDYNLLGTQFKIYAVIELLFCTLIWGMTYVLSINLERTFILKMFGVYLLSYVVQGFLRVILQATNRIADYAKLTLFDRVVYIILVVLFLLLGFRNYEMMIYADIIAKVMLLVFTCIKCKEIVLSKISDDSVALRKDSYYNLSSGIKVNLANVASIFIIGIIRFAIERAWDIVTYAKVSLTLSISNMLMVLIRAISIVLFPMLKRMQKDRYKELYSTMRTILMAILLASLFLYYPIKGILLVWLPQYSESLEYMALLFPICIYESKTSMLIETFLKSIRKEKVLLIVNVTTLGLSFILSAMFTVVFKNLILSILSIFVLLSFRCIVEEIILANALKLSIIKDIVSELILSILFICTTWFFNGIVGFSIYGVAYLIYVILNWKKIVKAIHRAKLLVVE